MTTAAQLIDRATGLIAVRAIGQTLNGAVSADCFGYLNMMLDAWRLESGLTVTTKLDVPIVAGTDEYEISPTGDVVAVSPINVLSAFSDIGGTKYTAEVVPENTFDLLTDSTSNIPDYVFWDGLTLHVYPAPSTNYTLTLTIKSPLPEFATITTDVPLTAGMESAIASNLAITLSPIFEKQPGQLLMMTAANSKRALKHANFKPMAVDCPVNTGRSFDIVSGDYR